MTYLESEGYEHGKDLGYLEADDLKPHLKIFHVRKQLIGLQANAIDEPYLAALVQVLCRQGNQQRLKHGSSQQQKAHQTDGRRTSRSLGLSCHVIF